MYHFLSGNQFFCERLCRQGTPCSRCNEEADSQIEAIERYKQKHNLEFPLMRDNNHFHEYFSLGITPVFVLIDRDGIVRNAYSGFDIIQPEKTEKKLRAMIEEAL